MTSLARIERSHKKCPRCGKDQPIENFHSDASRVDRHAIYCRSCWKIHYERDPAPKPRPLARRPGLPTMPASWKEKPSTWSRAPWLRCKACGSPARPARVAEHALEVHGLMVPHELVLEHFDVITGKDEE